MTIASALPVAGFVGCVLAAAISDAKALRIPNVLCAAIAALFVLHAALDLGLAETLRSLGLAATLLVIGFIAFSRGAIGGGDVKLLAVCMAWAGPHHGAEFVIVTALAGGVLALAIMSPYLARATAGLQRNWPKSAAADARSARAPMPYGVAIAAGALVVAARIMAS